VDTHATADAAPSARRLPHASVLLLLALGLLGHLYAAHAIGGSRTAYTHHVLGFLFILVVTGGLIAGLGRLFWRTRTTLTLLAIAVVQALLGLWVASESLRASAGP
jgi:hypothetical protein